MSFKYNTTSVDVPKYTASSLTTIDVSSLVYMPKRRIPEDLVSSVWQVLKTVHPNVLFRLSSNPGCGCCGCSPRRGLLCTSGHPKPNVWPPPNGCSYCPCMTRCSLISHWDLTDVATMKRTWRQRYQLHKWRPQKTTTNQRTFKNTKEWIFIYLYSYSMMMALACGPKLGTA